MIFTGWRQTRGCWNGAKAASRGVEWLQAYRGDQFWQAMKDGVWSPRLFNAALCRSHTLAQARPGFHDIDFRAVDDMRALVKDPVAYQYKHSDGPVATMILMSGFPRDFNFAADLHGLQAVLNADVSADAGWPDDAREFLQSAGASRRADVPDGQGAVPDRANASDDGLDGRGCGQPVCRRDTARNSAPGDQIPTQSRVTFWRT